MIREGGPDDRAAIESLLTARIDQAMFPLVNLRDHGLIRGDFPGRHDHAQRIWRTGNSLVALTRAGMILPLLDGSPDLTGLKTALRSLCVTGAVGPAASARPVLAELGLDRLSTATDRDEPGFALALDRLSRAVLFAASAAAARACRAIGFQPLTTFTLFLLSTPMRIA